METSLSKMDLLQDCIERIEGVRRAVMKFVEPFPLHELNDKPCGKGGSTRQHLNHLWATETWFTERVVRALKGEPDISREAAREELPDVLGVLIKGPLHPQVKLSEVDQSEPIQKIFERLEDVRKRTRKVLSNLKIEDLHKNLIESCGEEKTVRNVLNHMHSHEVLHTGIIIQNHVILQRE